MAKCFTIHDGTVEAHILARGEDGERPVIYVGEEGRGRKLVRVPLPPGTRINHVAPETWEVKEVPGDGVVLLIRDHSGYRGSWYAAPVPTAPTCPYEGREGKIKVEDPYSAFEPPCPGCGAPRYKWKAKDHYLPPGMPENTALFKAIGATVIAMGLCAQGLAGRMGGGPEFLVAVPFGWAFTIRRWGRLYGAPAILEVEVLDEDGGTVNVKDWRAEWETAQAAARW